MATLQKFKLLATQCAVAGSPTTSPTASPVIHLRRRKTLRMLLGRGGGGGRRGLPHSEEDSSDRPRMEGSDCGLQEKGKELAVSHKLRDLFVSSPPLEERGSEQRSSGSSIEREGFLQETAFASFGNSDIRRFGGRSLRPLSATFRQRLLRRAWRPVLVTIPE